ncbi:PadR family transcriptional regulator [Phenylobacterium immobile]|uniref:PadR family transcriptional regulator n=1 Tax=Phenylobacterium immobile TaxID=21 RepID=UPI000AA646A9|nr:PadR family transcriptional regulator [Phenylobacterium immobile]
MHRHFHNHEHKRFGRHPFGGPGMRGERPEGRREGRGRPGRVLGHGDLRLVILALIEEQPRHGYELIKALEDRTGGAYRPSPGVIYPTLSLLEDEGLIRPQNGESARKLFELTEAGFAELEVNRAQIAAMMARIDSAGEGADTIRPRIMRARANLDFALKARLGRRPISADEIDRVVALLDEAASAIEKV